MAHLDHPELGEVARCVGILRTERGPERVDRAEGAGIVLAVELARDGEVRGLAKEVLRGMCADARQVEDELRSDHGMSVSGRIRESRERGGLNIFSYILEADE